MECGVIWSRAKGALHVAQEAVNSGDLRGGCGCLSPSMTQVLRRNSACPRVLLPAPRRESWTVLGEDDAPLVPVERYLAYLSDIEKSPNTVKA